MISKKNLLYEEKRGKCPVAAMVHILSQSLIRGGKGKKELLDVFEGGHD